MIAYQLSIGYSGYVFSRHDNTNSEPNQPTVTILIDNFSGKIIRIRVSAYHLISGVEWRHRRLYWVKSFSPWMLISELQV